MSLANLTAAKSSAEARIAAITAELAAMSVTTAGGKPDAVDGVKHYQYKMGLLEELKVLSAMVDKLDEQIATNDADGSCWEVVSEYE